MTGQNQPPVPPAKEKPSIDLYFEKKELEESKERDFLAKIEAAESLLNSADFNGAVAIYVSLLPMTDEMQWLDKKRRLKDLIFDAREKEKRHLAGNRQRLEMAQKAQHERDTFQKALDLMNDASEKYKEQAYVEAKQLYQACLQEFEHIDACNEIEMIKDSIEKIDSEILEMNKQLELKRQTDLRDEKTYLRHERVLQNEKRLFDEQVREALERMKQLQQERVEDKRKLEEAVSLLHEANEKFRVAKSSRYISEGEVVVTFDEVVKLFALASSTFKEADWHGELAYITESITLVEKERERKLDAIALRRDNERKLEEMAKVFSVPVVSVHKAQVDLEAKARVLDEKQRAVQARQDKVFAVLDEANRSLVDYEKKAKIIGDSFKENEYPAIIDSYTKALAAFKELGGSWGSEMEKIDRSIAEVRRKEATFLAERSAFERAKRERQEQATRDKASMERRHAESRRKEDQRSVRIQTQAEAQRRERERLQDEIDQIMNAALYHFKKYDFIKSAAAYQQAKDWMDARGWTKEAAAVAETIEMILERQKAFEQHLTRADTLDESIERVASQVSARQLEGPTVSEEEREAIIARQAAAKRDQEAFSMYLNQALDAMREKRFLEAVPFFEEGLKIAESLKWTFQVQDVREYIKKAKDEHARAAGAAEKRQKQLEAQEKLAEQIRGPAEVAAARVIDPAMVQQREREKALSDEAFKMIDVAKSLQKSERNAEAVDFFRQAMENFVQIGWKREADMVQEQMTSLERKMEAERQSAGRQRVEQRAGEAYAVMNSAEVHLGRKQFPEAITLYNQASAIFEEIGFAKEREMVLAQIEVARGSMRRLDTLAKGQDIQFAIDRGVALVEEARQLARKNQVFKAWEAAKEAASLFARAGDAGARDLAVLQPLLDDLEAEKVRKEEILKKLQSGQL